MKKMKLLLAGIRRDESQPNTLNCWIVSDNLRKGAATNAVQIAEYLLKEGVLGKSLRRLWVEWLNSLLGNWLLGNRLK